MNVIEVNPNNLITWRNTPWDARVFNMETAEIIEFQFDNDTLALQLLKEFEKQSQAALMYGRFNASDLKVKKAMLSNSYLPLETSLCVYLPNLKSYKIPTLFARRKIALKHYDASACLRIAKLGASMFNYSRFHENPFIERELADNRMSSWITDMASQDVQVLVSEDNNGEVTAFMIYTINELGEIYLNLGGVVSPRNPIAPFFWASVVDYFIRKQKKSIRTVISAANNAVLSLYLGLNFRINRTNIDYQKIIEEK